MKPRTLLVLLVLVAGLGAFIWFYERKLPSGEERAEQAKKVLQLERDEIEAIEVAWQGRTLRLEKVRAPEATWRIVRPLFSGQPARADEATVARLLDSLLGLEKARTLEDFDPKQVGLDRPRGTVTLETKDGKEVLSIGAAVPTGAKMIVGRQGADAARARAFVVDDGVLSDLERAPGDWRDREMFPGERADIQRITLRGGAGGPVVLARQGEEFRLARPAADRADRDLVDALLTDLAGLRAEQFLDDLDRGAKAFAPGSDGGARPAALGLAPPRRAVEVAFTGGTPAARIELGRTDATTELTAVRIGRQLFEARTGLGEATDRPPRAWRSPAWTGLEVFAIDRARFTDPAGTVEVVRADTDWKRGKDLISFTVVSDVLFALSGAKADALLTAAEARQRGIDLAKPTLTIALNGGGPPKGETLTLYPPAAGGVPARAAARDVVLLLPPAQVAELQARLADLRQAAPLPPAEREKDGDTAEE